MILLTRWCRECGQDQPFDQPHGDREHCPDVPDGECPEWACTGCGTALIAGLPAAVTAAGSSLRGVA